MFDIYLPPATPTGVQTKQANDNYLIVSWSPSTTKGIKHYRVEQSVTNSGVWTLAQETPYTSIQQPVIPNSYQYRVAAIDLFGNQSPWSSEDGTQGSFSRLSGRIANYGTDGSTILDNTISMSAGNTYILESTSDYGAGLITDQRRIVTAAGTTKQVQVSPPFIGVNATFGISQPTLITPLDANIAYLDVTGGTITCWTGQNFTGTSQTFGIGTYRNDRGGLGFVSNNIRSIQIPLGATVFCSQAEVARNPQIATNWKVSNLGADPYTTGFVAGYLADGSVVLDGNVNLAAGVNYELETYSDVAGIYVTAGRPVVTASGITNTLLTSPSYLNENATYTIDQNILGTLDNIIGYLNVTEGMITCWTGQNLTGISQAFSVGTYRSDRQQFGAIQGTPIRSIQVPTGASVFATRTPPNTSPIVGTPWTLYQV